MKTLPLLLSLLALAGCTTATKTYGPDGKEAYSVVCNGTAQSWADCQLKAGEICGAHGYNVISQNGERGAVFGGSYQGFGGGSTHTRAMMIQCKG